MKYEVFDDPDSVARAGARRIAAEARQAVASRGRFSLAVSGGRTPWIMLRALAAEDVPWAGVHIFQVDERIAPQGDPDRNLTHLRDSLLAHAPLDAEQIHAMPVESSDWEAGAQQYAAVLRAITGSPAILDLVHLGLGPDGHTASLVPGDPALQIENADVAVTGVYQGRHRMTLTYPVLDGARSLLWIVTGGEKQEMFKRLIAGDPSIPAGRVRSDNAVLLADRAATGERSARSGGMGRQ